MGSGGVQGCDTTCDDTRCPQSRGSGEKPCGDFEACRGCSRADSSTSAQRPADLGERPLLTSAPGVASHGLRQGAGQSGGLWATPVVDVGGPPPRRRNILVADVHHRGCPHIDVRPVRYVCASVWNVETKVARAR